jgi:hypothetical protein
VCAVEADANRDFVADAEGVLDVEANVGEALPHGLGAQFPDLAPTQGLGHSGKVGDVLFRSSDVRVTPRNVTALIDALERTGFVSRTEHASDRRAVLVQLTQQGRVAAVRMESEANALAQDLFGELSPAVLATVVRALDHVAARIAGTA